MVTANTIEWGLEIGEACYALMLEVEPPRETRVVPILGVTSSIRAGALTRAQGLPSLLSEGCGEGH